MKYIVITSKHHDGFAMYHSTVSKYNIYDATPFKRDPMKELADAAQKAGIRLCFYYSQTQDWHEPDAVGNDWDFKDESKKNFARYLEEKVKPVKTTRYVSCLKSTLSPLASNLADFTFAIIPARAIVLPGQ